MMAGVTGKDFFIKATHYRWVVVGLLFFITVVNYIDRSAISYAITSIAKEMSISDSQKGLILGAFGIGYAFTTFLGGVLVDRYGARIVLTISVALWVVSIGMTGVATGFILLLAARAALGLAEGPMFPGLEGTVANWLPPHERVRALAYSLAAVPIALAIGAPVVTTLIAWFDWRAMFYILAAVSLVWLPLWFFLFRDSPSDSKYVNEAELKLIQQQAKEVEDTAAAGMKPANLRPAVSDGATATTWTRLLTNRTLLANYWAFFVFGYFLFFFMTWLPSYLESVFKLSVTQVGWFSVVPWAAAAIVLLILGRASDAILERTKRLRASRTYLIAGTQFIAAIAIIPAAFATNLTLSLVCISIALAASMGANAAYYAINVDVAPDRSATALGIMDFGFALAGFAAPVVTGFVVGDQGNYVYAFLLMSVLATVSVIATLIFHRPDADAINHPYPEKAV